MKCATIPHNPTDQNPHCLWKKTLLWVLLILVVFGIRAYLYHLLPTYLWSKDAGSYARSAFEWLQTGKWETDPRRGPVYSLFLAACLRIWGDFNAVIVVQHLLGAAAVLSAIAVLQHLAKTTSRVALFLCGYAYAVYGGILHMGHLIRNETLLLFFGSAALIGWYAALHFGKTSGFLWSGIATALLTMTKNVYTPLPLFVFAAIVLQNRANWRKAVMPLVAYALGLILPFAGATFIKPKTKEPQEGFLLFARVAQFTVLDGGIQPALKEIIRADIESYRTLPKLDNNLILKRTAVPKINEFCREHGQSKADANRLCRALAFEAIKAHPKEYARQVLGDLFQLQFKNATRITKPDAEDTLSNAELLGRRDFNGKNPAWMHVPETIALSEKAAAKGHFSVYKRITTQAWLFAQAPVFLTTLLLPVFIWFTRAERRFWWLGLAVLWYFTIALLSTVGRPMDRYLVPVAPVMFWTLGAAAIWLCNWTLGQIQKFRTRP